MMRGLCELRSRRLDNSECARSVSLSAGYDDGVEPGAVQIVQECQRAIRAEKAALLEIAEARQAMVRELLRLTERSNVRRMTPTPAMRAVSAVKYGGLSGPEILDMEATQHLGIAAWNRVREAAEFPGADRSAWESTRLAVQDAAAGVLAVYGEKLQIMAKKVSAVTRTNYEDLEGIGFVALLVSAEKYDPEKGEYGSYLATWCKTMMLRHAQKDRPIRLPEKLFMLRERVDKAVLENLEATGRQLSVWEIAAELNESEDRVQALFLEAKSLNAEPEEGGISIETIGRADDDPLRDYDSRIYLEKIVRKLRSLSGDPENTMLLRLPFPVSDPVVGSPKTLPEATARLLELRVAELREVLLSEDRRLN